MTSSDTAFCAALLPFSDFSAPSSHREKKTCIVAAPSGVRWRHARDLRDLQGQARICFRFCVTLVAFSWGPELRRLHSPTTRTSGGGRWLVGSRRERKEEMGSLCLRSQRINLLERMGGRSHWRKQTEQRLGAESAGLSQELRGVLEETDDI